VASTDRRSLGRGCARTTVRPREAQVAFHERELVTAETIIAHPRAPVADNTPGPSGWRSDAMRTARTNGRRGHRRPAGPAGSEAPADRGRPVRRGHRVARLLPGCEALATRRGRTPRDAVGTGRLSA
jgi:hypothetical protein